MDIMKRMVKDKVKFVNLQFSDIMGQAKSITIPIEKIEDVLKDGMWFDGSSIEGFTRIFESDMILMPDLRTYAVMPWLSDEHGKTARFICDVHLPDGSPYEDDPRYILKKALKEAEDLGYSYNTGPELEFFLFKKDNGLAKIELHDKGKYFDLVMDNAYDVRRDMIYALEKMGIEIEASHHEVAKSQHEIDFKYGPALKTADNALTFKFTVKAIAKKHGLHATFMPKPITGVNGSGMHVHQSLFKKDKNAFYDENDEYNLSELAYQFLAGQMKHVKGMSAILSPLVNSYKRLVPGYEAASYICWARKNRSALIRVPSAKKGLKKATRLEIRCPDPSANPYLVFATLLKAGLDGIKNKLTPPKPVEEDVFELNEQQLIDKNIDLLPHSLWEAIKNLKINLVMKDCLGSSLHHKYIEAKTIEWDKFRVSVTNWEIKEYLDTV